MTLQPNEASPLAALVFIGFDGVSVLAEEVKNPRRNVLLASVLVVVFTGLFSGLQVYPNPWRSDKHAGKSVIFAHLPIGSTVKLFTTSGHLVKTLHPPVDTATWDLTNDSGDKVASGIYVYLITVGDTGYGSNGQKVRGKVAVIK